MYPQPRCGPRHAQLACDVRHRPAVRTQLHRPRPERVLRIRPRRPRRHRQVRQPARDGPRRHADPLPDLARRQAIGRTQPAAPSPVDPCRDARTGGPTRGAGYLCVSSRRRPGEVSPYSSRLMPQAVVDISVDNFAGQTRPCHPAGMAAVTSTSTSICGTASPATRRNVWGGRGAPSSASP
jgi:hypothetical protein